MKVVPSTSMARASSRPSMRPRRAWRVAQAHREGSCGSPFDDRLTPDDRNFFIQYVELTRPASSSPTATPRLRICDPVAGGATCVRTMMAIRRARSPLASRRAIQPGSSLPSPSTSAFRRFRGTSRCSSKPGSHASASKIAGRAGSSTSGAAQTAGHAPRWCRLSRRASATR